MIRCESIGLIGLCALASMAVAASEPVRADEPVPTVTGPEQGIYRPWGRKRPLFPDPWFDGPELAPLRIDRQNSPDRDLPLTLSAAVGTALAHSEVVRVLDGGAVFVSPATQYDPTIAAALRDVEYTAFDPKLSAAYYGGQIDEPPDAVFGPGLSQNTRRDEGNFAASVSKLWQSGATTRFGYDPSLGYLFFPFGASGFNPLYTSAFVFEARQPILRGAGFTVNQAPLRIAQLRQEQTQWEFKQAVQAQVRSIEEAYWDLQAAFVQLQAIDAIVPFAEEAVRLEEARFQLELTVRADVARARVQLMQFKQQRIELEANAKEKEFRLRNLMGRDAVDGTRLVPADPPAIAPPEHNPDEAAAVAAQNRPDLVQRRMGLRIRELEYFVAANGLKPQLDFQALYRANGVGQGLDDALNQAMGLGFMDWTVGLTFSVPLGNRAAKANLRVAEAQLSRDRALLRENVRNIGFRIADLIRSIRATWDQYQLARQRMDASQEWLMTARIRFTTPPPTSQSQDSLLLLLSDYQTALRANMDAIAECSQLIARYNGLQARLEETQGTLLVTRGVELADDPVRAVNRHITSSPAETTVAKVPMLSPAASITPAPKSLETGIQQANWTQPIPASMPDAINPTGDYRNARSSNVVTPTPLSPAASRRPAQAAFQPSGKPPMMAGQQSGWTQPGPVAKPEAVDPAGDYRNPRVSKAASTAPMAGGWSQPPPVAPLPNGRYGPASTPLPPELRP